MVKKTTGDNINSKLSLVMKSGKYVLGYKSTLRALRSGDAKLVILSNNCPTIRKGELEYYAAIAKAKVVFYAGNNIALGTACGRYHRCSTLAIIDAGDSDILAQWGFMIHLFKLILRLFLFMPKTNKIGMLKKGQKSLSRFVEFEWIQTTNQVICLLIKFMNGWLKI